MRRRARRPGTHLLRAGQRTAVFASKDGVPELRFRAQVLQGRPEGRVEIETGDADKPDRSVLDLGIENALTGDPIRSVSVVPAKDTAITFETGQSGGGIAYTLLGAAFVVLATVWTAWDFVGG